jgi:hypothetical protein
MDLHRRQKRAGGGVMNGIGDDRTAPDRGGGHPWRLVALPALGAAFGFALALALPARSEALAAEPGTRPTCPAMASMLPPGHPPIAGLAVAPPASGIALPPGHPPVPGLGVAPPAEGPALPPGHPPIGGPGSRPSWNDPFGSDAPPIIET